MPHRCCARCRHWGGDEIVEIDEGHVEAVCTNPFSINNGRQRRAPDACLQFSPCTARVGHLAHQAHSALEGDHHC